MRRNAFTLVELLVVVAIIGLLVAMLIPSLDAARHLALSAICRGNLNQIGKAFQAADAATPPSPGGPRLPLFQPRSWPGVPMNVVSTPRMYLCPEEGDKGGSINDYFIHSNWDGKSVGGAGVDIPFDPDDYLCRIVSETADYIDYGFEDGINWDLDNGTIDITIRVTKRPPYVGTYMSTGYQGASSPYVGVLSLYCGGGVVPGWEDFRNVPTGKTFNIKSGGTNYGINNLVGRYVLGPDTVVLLDYNELIANRGEDIGLALEKVVKRHRGSVNVLFADLSVRGLNSAQLDPNIGTNADRWSP